MNLALSLTSAKLSFLFISALITVQLVAINGCLQPKCVCKWQSNKLSADCSLQKLTTLPQASKSSQSDESQVQAINLSQNNLFELKKNIFLNSNLINLQKIILQKVGLERVDEKAFEKLNNLIDLDLSQNSLKDIPSKSFTPIPKLRSLDISFNLISVVPNQSFKNLLNLRQLSIERNRINFIDDNAFEGLLNLEILKLSQNYLIYIGSQILVPLTKLHSLELSENQWKCDCKLRSVRKYLLANSNINIPDEPKCLGSNKVWTQLGLDSFLCPPVIQNNYSSSDNIEVTESTTLKLDCAVILIDVDDTQPPAISWHWNNIPISNNSKGCGEDCQIQEKSQQYFRIFESFVLKKRSTEKLKISRLELSSVLSFNSGSYLCIAQNNAGNAQKFFNIVVTAQDPKRKITPAVASAESHVNESQKNISDESGTDKVVIGLILGILFGVFLVLVLFGISIILLCRRRHQKHINNRNNSVVDGTELEKLTPNSNSSLKVNPIQKPPRLQLEKHNFEKEIPQVWLIKHNTNGNSNVSQNQSFNESNYSTQYLFNDNYEPYDYDSQHIPDYIKEPDIIHPSAYVRERHIQVTDLDQLSAHSDGTEV